MTAFWPVAVVQVGIAVLVLATLLPVVLGRNQFPWHPALLAGAVCPAWGLLQLALHRTPVAYTTILAVLSWFTLVSVFLLGLLLLSSARLRNGFLNAFLAFGVVTSVVCLLQSSSPPNQVLWLFRSEYDTVFGPFPSRNAYAAFTELVLPVALWRLLREPERRTLWLSIVGLLYSTVIFSASRAGFVLTTLELAVLLPGARRHWRNLALLAIVVMAVLVIAGGNPLWQRWQRDPLLGERPLIVRSALAMWKDHPVWGVGLGNFPLVYPAYALYDNGRFVNHVHNDFLEWAVEGGAPFLFFTLLGAAFLVKPVWRSRWALGLVAVTLHSLIDFPLNRYYVALWAALVAAAAVREADSRKEARQLPVREQLV